MKQLPQTLTEEMLREFKENFDYTNQEDTNISSIEDLALVHRTKFLPHGILKTQRDLPEAMQDFSRSINILDNIYDVYLKHERDTVHFSINGEVRNHDMGDFSGSRYIVIIPGELIEREDFIGGNTVDFYSNGSYEIPTGAIILCPDKEKEIVSKMNNNATVIGYEGETADRYGDLLLSKMGYRVERIGTHSWKNDKDASKVSGILSEHGYRINPHFLSQEFAEELLYQDVHELTAREEIIKQEGLFTTQSANELINGSRNRIKNVIENIILKNQEFHYSKESIERLINVFSSELESITNSPVDIPQDIENLSEEKLNELQEEILKTIYEPRINEILPDCVENFTQRYRGISEVISTSNSEEKENLLNQICVEFAELDGLAYFSDTTLNQFYTLLENNGVSLSEEQKQVMDMLYNCDNLEELIENVNNDDSLSYDIKTFVGRHSSKNKSEFFIRLLSKDLEDKYINSKHCTELTEDEQKQADAKIADISCETQEIYVILPNLSDEDKTICIEPNFDEYETNREIIKNRLNNREHFANTGVSYTCDLGYLHKNETVGQYISRMMQLVNKINSQIAGNEEIDFSDIAEQNEYGVTIQSLIRNALGNEEIRSTEIEAADKTQIRETENLEK